MVIDMNYWGKVFKNIVIVLITIIGIYLAFKLAIFYMPFLIAFIFIFNDRTYSKINNEKN